MPIHIGFLLYPDLTQLDVTGPYEVLSLLPDAKLHLVWKDLTPVRAYSGMCIVPSVTVAACPPLDVVCVPGGPGTEAAMRDEVVLDFLRAQARHARYITSVCTGSLVLGAAGLLDGRRATSHWAFVDRLAPLGAIYTPGRLVVDGPCITGGGVTAGIDFALRVAAELCGEPVAKAIQLMLEYRPAPPFQSGHPDVAEASVIRHVRAQIAMAQETGRLTM